MRPSRLSVKNLADLDAHAPRPEDHDQSAYSFTMPAAIIPLVF